MKRIIAVVCILLFSSGIAQVPKDSVNKNPYFVILNFDYNLSSDHYNPNEASLSLPPNTTNRVERTEQLKKILDGKGLQLNPQKAPKNADYYDSTFHRNVYYPIASFKDVYLEKTGKQWYVSQETVDNIPELYNEAFKFTIDVKKYFTAPFWYKKIFGATVLSWLFFAILLGICFLVFKLTSKIYNRIISTYFQEHFKDYPNYKHHIHKSGRVFGLYISSLVFLTVLPSIQLPLGWNSFLQKAVGIASVVFFVTFICRIIDGIFHNIDESQKKKNKTNNSQYQDVVRTVLKFVVITLGFFYILYYYMNVNIESILAGLSIGGLAVALAAQDTVKNLIGSVVILVDKPFEVNDWIQFEGEEGIVEEVGVRSTRVRSFENSVIYVPNSTISNGIVNNKGLRKYRRLKLKLTIEYSTPVDSIHKYVEDLRNIIEEQPKTVKNNYDVYLNDFSEDGLHIHFSCFLDVNDSKEEYEARQTILMNILKLSNELKIKKAYPSRSLYIEDDKSTNIFTSNLNDENKDDTNT